MRTRLTYGYVLILNGARGKASQRLATKVRRSLRNPHFLHGVNHYETRSIRHFRVAIPFGEFINLLAEESTAVAEPSSEPSSGTPIEKMEPASRPLNVTVELLNSGSLSGTLVDADVVTIKTAFGEAAIPLSEIAGIRFATREDVTTTVVMINGDSITGATDVKLVTGLRRIGVLLK